jgi:hypothetical protein
VDLPVEGVPITLGVAEGDRQLQRSNGAACAGVLGGGFGAGEELRSGGA